MTIFITRYFKKHYSNNLSLDIKCSKADDSDGTLLDTLSNFDEYKNPRIEAAFTRAKYSKIKDIEKVLAMKVAGYTQKEIAYSLGVTETAISRRIKEFRSEFECIEKICKITHNIKVSQGDNIVELSNRKALIDRAKYLIDKYSFEPLFALRIAEQEFEKQIKMGELKDEKQDYRFYLCK